MKFLYKFLILFLIIFSVPSFAEHSNDYYSYASSVLQLLKEGNTTSSVSQLKEMIELYGEDDFILTTYAVNMILGKEYPEAIRVLNTILEKNPNDKYANYCLGVLCLKDKKVKDAFYYFDKIKSEISDYKTLSEYSKIIENTNNEIALTEEESFNSIAFDGYVLLRSGNFEDCKKFFDMISTIKGENAYIEQAGFLFSYDFKQPISFCGVKYGEEIGLTKADRNKGKTVSGNVTVKADISKVRNVRIVYFYVDDLFKGMSNSSPSITLDTTMYSNGYHDVRIDAIDYENNVVSSNTYTLNVFNKSSVILFYDDTSMWNELWKFMQLKTSQASVNYLTAVCSAKLNNTADHKFALEKCVACDPDYKDAKTILLNTYYNFKRKKLVERGPSNKKQVAITFDDGPTKETLELLEILKEYNAKATFFLVGKMATKNPEIVKKIEADGHQIALHSQNHLNLTRLDYYDLQKEIFQGYCSVKNSGVSPSFSLRPPGGNSSHNLGLFADEYGLSLIMWTKNTTHLQQSRPEDMAQYCYNSLKPGFIYLLHNNVPVTTKALPLILSYFKSKGYECVTVNELIYGK